MKRLVLSALVLRASTAKLSLVQGGIQEASQEAHARRPKLKLDASRVMFA